MKKSLGMIVLVAACGGPAKTGDVGNEAGAPSGPAPTVAWSTGEGDYGGSFATTGLPAIAAGGGKVVYAHQGEDGGRGQPNLVLVVKDAQDAETDRVEVLGFNESSDDAI